MGEVKNGIYLEKKKSTLGVGHTAKETEFRNFWMTITQSEGIVQCVLLDQDFQLTGISEKIPEADFENGRLVFIPQGEKRYQRLLRKLLDQKNRREAQKARTASETKPAQAQPAAKWWEQSDKEVQPGDVFKKDPEAPKQLATPPSSKNWWESGPAKELTEDDIFGRPHRSESKPEPVKKKKPQANLKKTWWDK
jgi:hypothetical protein